ncbi:MAG TPA: NADH-quinone oxidoreductase subunit J [Geobacteraceae bacterium]|nr:NADH-quinone oxidoreductase subunit J [Geobacteraceae bacterium]
MILYRYLAETGFFLFVAMVAYGGFVAMRARYLMNAVLGLSLSLLGVAGLFFYLGSQFLALMQILICIGAICIIIAFGVMVGPKPKLEAERRVIGERNMLLALSACAAGFCLLSTAILRANWTPATNRSGDFSVKYLGENLLYQFCLPFELISVVLLVAIIGALIISDIGRRKQDNDA